MEVRGRRGAAKVGKTTEVHKEQTDHRKNSKRGEKKERDNQAEERNISKLSRWAESWKDGERNGKGG